VIRAQHSVNELHDLRIVFTKSIQVVEHFTDGLGVYLQEFRNVLGGHLMVTQKM
jgi:hypothetical protein